ncbi:hypothetical protein CON65_23055 [Bacillus pseudomycoides]|uniref:DUF1294 domain-containing protein n=1 Tax=Bacillus pseudomycoides TaxID=64104 RepID=A0AA91V8W6_9BACI|nr:MULTISPECIES: DUF1294 domain-containing protein [Bacillus]PEB52334.1 hypothetical protein COO03_12390 [Bacillus sp. AFS098217]PED80389.1 hypothetical protein CON65_23055 [Bacillus pseudomycoides]PEU09573.1 hypothetical protein CN525_24465 [Bacillus sp. AFS014408]PEU12802.1 hypothetical protein CN524_12285 [Bacillus sp. AFS019443]PFW62898.1 hypothetical protein COL20_11235 [Bacillus sp. AFS075034]
MSIIAFSMIGIDKRKAVKKQWCTPESTLFLVSVAGGAIGAWIGMYVFHHKIHKNKFKIGVPILVVMTSYALWVI